MAKITGAFIKTAEAEYKGELEENSSVDAFKKEWLVNPGNTYLTMLDATEDDLIAKGDEDDVKEITCARVKTKRTRAYRRKQSYKKKANLQKMAKVAKVKKIDSASAYRNEKHQDEFSRERRIPDNREARADEIIKRASKIK